MNTDVVLFMRDVWPFLASFLWNCALSLFVCLVSGEKYDPTWLLFLCCHANITIELFLMSEIYLWWVAMGDPLGSFCCSSRMISIKASRILLFVSYFFSPGISRWSSSAVLLLPPVKRTIPEWRFARLRDKFYMKFINKMFISKANNCVCYNSREENSHTKASFVQAKLFCGWIFVRELFRID